MRCRRHPPFLAWRRFLTVPSALSVSAANTVPLNILWLASRSRLAESVRTLLGLSAAIILNF